MATILIRYPRIPNRESLKDLLNGNQMLFWAVTLGFLAMGLGTSPVSIASGLMILALLVNGQWLHCNQLISRPWSWPILFLISLSWIGLIYTPDPGGIGLDFALKTHHWLACVTVAMLAFEKIDFKQLVYAFFIGLSLSAIVGWMQFAGVLPPRNGQLYTGFGSQYSTINVYLIVAILTASDLCRRASNWNQRIVHIVFMMLFFSHLIIMRGRSGYLTLLILSPLIARNIMGKFSIPKVFIVCLLLPAIMYLSPVVRQRVDRTVDELHFHVTTNPQKAWGQIYSRFQDRFFMWHYTSKVIYEHPFIGIGTGGLNPTLKQLKHANAPEIDHPHNDLLYLGVSYGILGILAYFWFYGTLFINGWRYRYKLMARFIFYVALTMVLSGMLNGHMLDSGTAFLLAMTAGLQQGLGISNQPNERQGDTAQ